MSTKAISGTTYNKRPGTSGIRGQLYETKLISLIHFRATHDDSVEEFHLATNVDKLGTFDDICFKAKVKGFDRPLAVFIQAKHRENEKRTLKNDLAKYFESYLAIRHAFEPNSNDVLFKGKFEETECLFVMYTTASDEFENNVVESSFANKLNDLVGTDGAAKQPYKNEEDMDFLCKIAMKEEIISLAGQMVKFICGESNLQMLLSDEFVLRYHVILAQKVIDISEIQPEGHRIGTFRQEFFETNEEFLILLKDTLYTEILKKIKLEENDKNKLLSEFFEQPSEIKILSKLIGTVIRYNNGQFEFVDKMSTEDFKRKLNELYISQSTVNKAIELATKEILSPRKFKIPTAFGNKDLTIGGNPTKIEKRLNHLTSKIFELLDKSESNNIVTIDESLENGLLQLNGGIAGAVGNILVCDDNTKLMKFTDNCELLGDLAKRLFVKLKSRIHNLHEYKFNIKVKKFPKLSFDGSEYEENLARDFLNKLLFYTNQADEEGVEEILKNEIEDNELDLVNNFRVRNDAIYLKYHDEIQKWWMLSKQASYLTKESDMFEKAKNNIVKDPLMSVVNMMYCMNNKLQQINYTFTEDALRSLKLQDQHSRTVIITENSALTVAKVLQCLKNKDHVVLDLDYILNLLKNDCNALCKELTNANEEKLLIFVSEKIQNSRNVYKTLEFIAKAVHNKKTIIVTNQTSAVIINKYFLQAENDVYDKNNNLIDMIEESQKDILKTARVILQGKEVSLDLIIDDDSMACVEGDVLNRIINKDTIVVGKPIGNSNYDEMKHLYIDRRIKKTKNYIDKVIETLHDIVGDVVLITAKPGMGKSTLLTHLSLKTKELDPTVWIVRINLLEYSREFSKWKEAKTIIDSLETLNFMCQVILHEKLGKENEVKIELEEVNGIVHLKKCTGGHRTVFELKLFLHFYNRGKLIILFDGFDEICPHYMNEVIKCLKTVSNYHRKHKLWVTCRSYNEVISILEREFGTSYEIEHFSYFDKKKYLEKFWKSNLILKEFDSEQLGNVHEFLEFMSESEDHQQKKFEFLLHDIYINVSYYLINEIKSTHIPLWTYNKNIDDTYYVQKNADLSEQMHAKDSDGTPLHIYLIADYIANKLKEFNKKGKNWNIDINTFTVYERLLETKLKKIRFQEKNKMDIYNPDIMISYDKERTDFIMKHKNLAAYAIFHQYTHRHTHELFERKTLSKIEETIKFIEKGGEKTGLINSIADGIPIFVHMTYTEYFAVEYVCDLLKSEHYSEMQKSWIYFIFNEMFSTFNFADVRNIFDYKMKIDKALTSVLEKHKEIIFELLMEQGQLHSKYFANCHFYIHNSKTVQNELQKKKTQQEDVHRTMQKCEVNTDTESGRYWSLSVAVSWNLHHFIFLFISILESYLNEDNLDDFLGIVSGSLILRIAVAHDAGDALLMFVFDIVRKIDTSKLSSAVLDSFCQLPRDTKYDTMTSRQIVALIRKNYCLKEYLFKKDTPLTDTSRFKEINPR